MNTTKMSQDDLRTGMAFQCLCNFTTLQVPDIHLVVFTTGHDPFSARDTETGCDAILFVFVAHVRFQTARSVIIPEADRTIVRGRQDIFRIGRELHVLTDTRVN